MINKNLRVLLVEDQVDCFKFLKRIIGEIVPRHYASHTLQEARCYDEALEAITAKVHDLVVLDHRMPYANQTELERKNFDAFCKTLQNVGYELIPQIRQRNPAVTIIGTSSCDPYELRGFGRLDYQMDKVVNNPEANFERIMAEIEQKDALKLTTERRCE